MTTGLFTGTAINTSSRQLRRTTAAELAPDTVVLARVGWSAIRNTFGSGIPTYSLTVCLYVFRKKGRWSIPVQIDVKMKATGVKPCGNLCNQSRFACRWLVRLTDP